jgi:hypothetical protein
MTIHHLWSPSDPATLSPGARHLYPFHISVVPTLHDSRPRLCPHAHANVHIMPGCHTLSLSALYSPPLDSSLSLFFSSLSHLYLKVPLCYCSFVWHSFTAFLRFLFMTSPYRAPLPLYMELWHYIWLYCAMSSTCTCRNTYGAYNFELRLLEP